MTRGRLDDAAFRHDRARKARAAQNRPDFHLRQVIRSGSGSDDLDGWAAELAATLPPLTPAEAAAAGRLAATLESASAASREGGEQNAA